MTMEQLRMGGRNLYHHNGVTVLARLPSIPHPHPHPTAPLQILSCASGSHEGRHCYWLSLPCPDRTWPIIWETRQGLGEACCLSRGLAGLNFGNGKWQDAWKPDLQSLKWALAGWLCYHAMGMFSQHHLCNLACSMGESRHEKHVLGLKRDKIGHRMMPGMYSGTSYSSDPFTQSAVTAGLI